MIKLYKKVSIKNSKVEYDYKYEFEAYLPKVLTTSYKKVYRGIWTSKVKVIWSKQTAHVLNNLENYLFQIYDTSGEYIGAYIPNTTDTERVGKADVMTINCNHVLITLLDSIISEPLVFDSTDINKVITRLFSYQKIRLWKYVGMEHAEEAVDIDIKPQSGILSPLLEVATQLSPNYYFKYETEKFPFTLKLARATDRPAARIREGWNLMKPKYTEDPSNIYNRLYVYGEKPVITGIRKTDNPDKNFNEQLKKDTAAWQQYQRDYQAWKTKQIKMQKDRDAALEARKKLVASGKGSSGLPALPPRPSTVPPPDKPSLSSRTMGTQQVTIAPKNPTKKEYIEDVDSIKRYGLKERYLEFKDIADSELLYTIAKRIFERRDGYIYDYTIKAADLNKILEKPIPFDWIRLGTTVSLQTYRYGKEIDNELIITEESKEDIESHPENIELRVQLKSSASAPTVSNSPIGKMLSKIEEKEYDIIKAYESANGKNTIYAGKDAPPNPKVNDIWYRQTLDDVGKPKIEMLIFNGAIWVNPFAELDNIDETIARNEKELDALMEEAELSMSNLEKDVQKNAEDINKKVKELDDQIATKITEIEKSLKDSAAKVDQAVKDATDLLQGNLNTLEKQMQERVDKQMSEAQTELLAKATELVNGVEIKVDEKIGLLKKTIAQTTETTDGLKQKVTQFEESINGLSARMVETEKTANSAKTTVGEIQNSVNHLSSTFQTLQETSDSLKKRVSAVEQDANGLRTLIESTEKNLGGKISNLNTRIETAEGNYSTLSQKVDDVTEKTNKVVSTVDKNTATIAQQTKDISATSEKISTLSTTVTQTNDKVATIITNYAKKSDLKDLATKEFATTQIEAKAGELSTVISNQKKDIDASAKSINELKATDTQIKSDISQIKASNTQTTTKINTLNRTLDQMESAIMATNDGFVGLQDQVNRNVTQILQTKDRVNTIISDYAKKTDLNDLVTESKVNTIVEAKAGSIKTSLSSEITTLDKKVNGLQSRPVYAIGSDGYWYKDGKKTDTKALGNDGNNFKWNLIDGGDQTASSNKIVDNCYVFNQDIPEGTEISIGVSYKGVDRYMLFQLIINNSYTTSTRALQLKNNSDTTSIYTTTIKMPKSVQKGDRIRIFFNTPREKDTWKYIYWFSLVMGNQPIKEFVPSKNDIQGKDGVPGRDGKDAKVYKSSTAPSDTSQLWYNTKDGEVYVYYNGDWKNINATVQTKIHTVEDTVDSHTRTISSLDRGMSAMGEGVTDNKFQITEVKAQLEGFKSTVKNQDYLSIINQQAHQQIFEVKSGSYSSKLRITPETVYISSATIKSSHIASLSANKLTAGTIDAKQIKVINIDASNITTGKISGYRGYWNLNSGEIYNGYSYSNITIQNGVFQYGTYNGVGVIVDGDGININYRTTANGTYQHVGNLQASKWTGTTGFAANFRLGHKKGTSMTLSYYNESESVYNPYITFDKYRAYGGKKKRPGNTDRDITVNQDIGFDSDLYFDAYTKFMFYNGMRMQTCYITMTNGYKYSGIFIGNGWDSSHGLNSGLYICTAGLYFADGSATREIFTAGYHIKNVSYHSPPRN